MIEVTQNGNDRYEVRYNGEMIEPNATFEDALMIVCGISDKEARNQLEEVK